jgi:hypothetical protein
MVFGTNMMMIKSNALAKICYKSKNQHKMRISFFTKRHMKIYRLKFKNLQGNIKESKKYCVKQREARVQHSIK